MGDVFYIVGIGLTVLALVLSFVGLRREGFPGSRAAFAGVVAVIGALVVTTCAFAVVLAREEQEHREEERAHAAEESEEGEAATSEGGVEPAAEGEALPGEAPAESEEAERSPDETLTLSSPADGSLVFEPTELSAAAGLIAIEYENPAAVPHNVAIEAEGETLGESETVTGGDLATVEAELEPGEYVFFCAVPGHREAGMEGSLTIE
jgi:plastocyanin